MTIEKMSQMTNELLIYVTIFMVLLISITHWIENSKYKKSSYGKQTDKPLWKILINKGARGEYRMSEIADQAPFEHKLLFNCYIPNRKGDKTELDIIMLSSKGIYVIENKNYSGWIFGDEESKNWCETIKGKKYFFYNPIKQNKSHIKNLENFLQIGEDMYTSLITFNSDANLKKIKVTSPNIHVIHYKKLKKFLKEQADRPDRLSAEQIEELYQKLLPGTQLSEEEKQQHVERIKKQYK